MNRVEKKFVDTVWTHYKAYGRHDLPWRQKTHLKPYNILVSEMMLQQTQVSRVVPKYQVFLKAFPSTSALVTASLGDVLRLWQGLGYNRRAKYLKEAATVVHTAQHGRWSRTVAALKTLPGIGPYTAGAVVAFAYNEPVPIIETNIRTAYLHHFYTSQTSISDGEILRVVEQTLDYEHPREWYWALMDYGAHLKQTVGNQNTRSRQYKKQSRFLGSDRHIRGAILKLLQEKSVPPSQMQAVFTDFEPERINTQLRALLDEGLVQRVGSNYQLPE